MLNNVIFFGGIHGVGKSTLCKEICKRLDFQYLSASEVLKWKDLNEDAQNKKVVDIPYTQDLLTQGLSKIVQKDQFYLLDGHYCLLNKDGEVTEVPITTFKNINPISLNVVVGDIYEVKSRLEFRDGKPYNLKLLEEMQNKEVGYAQAISKVLGVPLNQVTQRNITEIIYSLQNQIFSK